MPFDPLHERKQVHELISATYDELRSSAAALLRRERPGHTLQATALVHELYLQLAKRRTLGIDNSLALVGIARHLMRRVLIDHGRRRNCIKRNAGHQIEPLIDNLAVPANASPSTELAEAIKQLRLLDPRQAQVVEMRFFGGLSVEATAAALGISEKTVKRDWATARAWLYAELKRGRG